MSTATLPYLGKTAAELLDTIAELLDRLGDIPASRVRLHPWPGTATEDDLLAVQEHEPRICELIDGVLVEKTVGIHESMLAVLIGHFLLEFVRPRNLGMVAGADGAVRMETGQVRVPDVAFYRLDRLPSKLARLSPIPEIWPDLAIEVLNKSNTAREMTRKLNENFAAGTELVWYVDPKTKTVRVYTEPECFLTLDITDTLDGGLVLPGFTLPVRSIFSPHSETLP